MQMSACRIPLRRFTPTHERKTEKCVGLLHLCSLRAFRSAVGRCDFCEFENRQTAGGELDRCANVTGHESGSG